MEGDLRNTELRLAGSYFYPRPPGGGRLLVASLHRAAAKISIHALRVEGDNKYNETPQGGVISIHALRVEGDRLGTLT